MRDYTHTEFTAAIQRTQFETPRLQQARTVYLALPAETQRAVVKACSGLANMAGAGPVTAFEIMVATMNVRGAGGGTGTNERR